MLLLIALAVFVVVYLVSRSLGISAVSAATVALILLLVHAHA